jgi:hypothetical protein
MLAGRQPARFRTGGRTRDLSLVRFLLAALLLCAASSAANAETYYRGGQYMDVKPNEYKLKNGKVDSDPVTARGLSLSTNKSKMQRFGGAYRVVWYPPTLQILQRGRDPEHYEIVPKQPMTVEEYQAALNQVKLEREDW